MLLEGVRRAAFSCLPVGATRHDHQFFNADADVDIITSATCVYSNAPLSPPILLWIRQHGDQVGHNSQITTSPNQSAMSEYVHHTTKWSDLVHFADHVV